MIQCGLVSLLLWLPAAFATADLITPANFELLGIHPDAQSQSTERGRTIANITPFEGSLYVGYGDWAWDTGPINIRHINPGSGLWSSSLLTFGTEAVAFYRAIDGRLYAPQIDPLGTPGVNPGGFAASGPGASWTQYSNVAATHVFDITGFNGSELWMVGAVSTQGVIWKSTDGGLNFTTERLDGPAAGSPPTVFSRYTGIAAFDGKLFVQRLDVNGVHNPISLVFDGIVWSNGPDLTPGSNGFLHRPSVFNNQLVYMDDDKSLGNLFRFDGTTASLAFPEKIRDFFILDGVMYALTESGGLVSTTDLSSWAVLGSAPLNAASLAVFGEDLFLGTTDASILKASHFQNVSAIPEPGCWLLLATCLLAETCRRTYRTRRRPSTRVDPLVFPQLETPAMQATITPHVHSLRTS